MRRGCDKYNAGMLTEAVVFQRATNVSDGAGGVTERWAAIAGAPIHAFIKALSGGERYASERIEATSKWRIAVRYFPGILESDRVQIRDRAYNIRFINNVELADRWLEIDLDGGVAT